LNWDAAPATVINFGLTKNWEAVFEGRGKFPFSSSDDGANLTDVAVLLKGVLRRGSLQGQTGPSNGIWRLLPGIAPSPGFCASLAGIVSQRWEWGAVHLNLATTLTRDQHADLFLGTFVEGPNKWPVRPVVEVFCEDEIGQSRTVSAFGGAI
jgi:hypothetical protein